MNKIRIIGLLILAVGVVFHLTLKTEATDFFTGLSIGVGIGLLITGRITKPSL
ncbi:hypothetical protein N7U66_15885 [Lacinutrix neustonica]|uniref:Uncharacterized protein n=1 Tax=Lacinutrix neustonica TaxID=2980107 RepID=A0A9E8SG83_9FLAO|nr:hypothetical protein [Lacinutrix neustonica]WAC01475.1 hypothetical protein N7U66_15885 [Lacinutrix neustonica]